MFLKLQFRTSDAMSVSQIFQDFCCHETRKNLVASLSQADSEKGVISLKVASLSEADSEKGVISLK